MQNKPKIFKNKKMLIAIGVVTVIIVAISVFVTFNIVTSNNVARSATELKAEADTLKARAVKAQKNNNNAAAIELLEEAKEKYEQAGDTNNVIDAESLLFISKQAK